MQPTYSPGDSPLHQLHPLTKLVVAGLILAATYLVPGVLTPLALFFVALLLTIIGGVAGAIDVQPHCCRVEGACAASAFTALAQRGMVASAISRPEGLLFAYLISARLLVLSTTIL
jgi:hypothetical protein